MQYNDMITFLLLWKLKAPLNMSWVWLTVKKSRKTRLASMTRGAVSWSAAARGAAAAASRRSARCAAPAAGSGPGCSAAAG